MGNTQSTTGGRKFKHFFPFLFQYTQLSRSHPDSPMRPLLHGNSERELEVEACLKKIPGIEKQVGEQETRLSRLESYIPLPPFSAKEINGLKPTVPKIQSLHDQLTKKSQVQTIVVPGAKDAAMEKKIKELSELVVCLSKKQEQANEKQRVSDAATEKKVAELTAMVTELRSASAGRSIFDQCLLWKLSAQDYLRRAIHFVQLSIERAESSQWDKLTACLISLTSLAAGMLVGMLLATSTR